MSLYFPTRDELAKHTIFPGVHIETAAADKMMVSVVSMEPGAVVEEHSHPHEQVGMMIAGRARFIIGGEEQVVGPGDVYRIPGNVRHKVICLDEPARVIDVFHPVREEYR